MAGELCSLQWFGAFVRWFKRFLLAGCIALTSVAAAAQEQPLRGVITVRAGTFAADASNAGISQSIAQDALLNAGAEDSASLARLVPGLSVNVGASTGVPNFTMRGAGLNDITSNVESTVSLATDDVAFPYAVMMRGLLFDLERVDVFKGPQGDAGGRSATGGRINFVSAAPTEALSGAFDWSADQRGVQDVQAALSKGLGGGFSGRLAGRAIWSDEGYQKSVSRPQDRLGARDEWAVRGSLAFDRGALQGILRLHWDQDRSENLSPAAYDGRKGGFGQSQPLPTPFDASDFFSDGDNVFGDWGADFRPQRRNTMRGATAHLNWAPNSSLSIESITGFGAFDRDERVEVAGVGPEDTRWRVGTHVRAFSEELRLRLNLKDVDLLLGGHYARDVLRERTLFGLRQSFFNQALGVNEILLRSRQESETAALFGAADWRATDRLRLLASARFTQSKKDWNACPFDSGDGGVAAAWNNVLSPFVIVPNGLPDPGALGAGQCALYNDLSDRVGFGAFQAFEDKSDYARWSGRLGFEAALSSTSTLRGSIATASKMGGYNGITAQTLSQATPYGPESVTAFEVGVRRQLHSGEGHVDVSAFFNAYRNKQETGFAITPVGNIPGLTNIPRAEVFGVEVSGGWRLSPYLSARINAAFTEAKIVRFEQIDPIKSIYQANVRFDSSGIDLPNAPRWQGNAALTYERPIAREYLVRAEAGLSYRSKSFGTADGRNFINDHVLVDARLTLSDAKNRRAASIWGRNIFNDQYWTSAYQSNGVFSRLNGAPATFGVTFSLRR